MSLQLYFPRHNTALNHELELSLSSLVSSAVIHDTAVCVKDERGGAAEGNPNPQTPTRSGTPPRTTAMWGTVAVGHSLSPQRAVRPRSEITDQRSTEHGNHEPALHSTQR